MPEVIEKVNPSELEGKSMVQNGAQATVESVAFRAAEQARRRRRILLASEYGIVAIGLLLVLVGVIAVPGFATSDNLLTVTRSASFVGIVALGMTFVVISGRYADLSVASQVAIAAVCAIALQPHGLAFALLCALAACLSLGMLNGLIIGYFGANPVVVTLGTGTLALAVLNQVTAGTLYSGQSSAFHQVTGATVGPIPLSFVAFLLVAGVVHLLLNRSTYGRRVRAVGSNTDAARVSGVPCARVILGAFLITALCCAVSGILLGGFSNAANPTIAQTYVFDSLAAIIVGGNSLTGGRGGAAQTVTGVLILAVISDLLVLKGLSFEWQELVTGAVIVAAVAFDAALRKLVTK
jgi:ribose transport system permease protein